MHATCDRCERILEFSGEPPKFCAYCGQPLGPTTAALAETAAAVTLPPDSGTAPPAAPGVADGVPQNIGGYRLLRRLGGGGMGSVYEAEDGASGRHVALKVIAAEYTGSPEAIQRFRQEGRLASGLAHSRCVFVLAADEEAGRPYIVMELMPGSTLEDLVRTGGPLPPELAITKILDVIDGLREAHRRGLVHRDVKPSNCFLEADGRVKVGDFGLSRSLAGNAKLTRTGTFIGTPLFASPEQIKMEPVDGQSDLYAVAATLFYLLTGKAPFQGGDMMATMARIVADEPPSLRSLRPGLPRALDRVMRRGLARDRRLRYKDLDEFRRALLPLLPARPSVGGTGLRLGAWLLDSLILGSVQFLVILCSMAAGVAAQIVTGPDLGEQTVINTVVGTILSLFYFGVTEGLWGWSPGKRLLRLRVGTATDNRPPGLGRGLLRIGILTGLYNSGPLALTALAVALGLPYHAAAADEAVDITSALLSMASGVWVIFAVIVLLYPMRPQNGYRGLHEILSGTRTYRLHWPQPPKRRPLQDRPFDLEISQPAGLPAQVGSFRVLGALRWSETERTLLAEDPQLGRRAWLWLRLATEPPLDAARRDINRPTRLRWVGCGEQDDWQWDAFLAPAGMPLPVLAAGKPRLTWSDARPILEDVTEELVASCTDATLPRSLTVAQVWVQPDGPVQLLGTPLHGEAGRVMGLLAADESGLSAELRALHFLRQVTITALEGTPPNLAAVAALEGIPAANAKIAGPVRAPLPVHAAEMLERLFAPGEPELILERWREDLAASRERPTEVTRMRRAGHLGVVALLHVPVLLMLALVCFGILVNFGRERSNMPPLMFLIIVFTWPLVWVVWAFVFRGGYCFWRGGIHLRCADGRKPKRAQCGGRTLLVWFPPAGVLALAYVVAYLAPSWQVVYFGICVLSVLLLPLYAFLALRWPQRSVHDRLTSTYLVPD